MTQSQNQSLGGNDLVKSTETREGWKRHREDYLTSIPYNRVLYRNILMLLKHFWRYSTLQADLLQLALYPSITGLRVITVDDDVCYANSTNTHAC